MPQAPEFKREQRGVALAMAGALATTIMVLGIVATSDHSASAPFANRMQAAIRTDVFVIAWLIAAIGNVARLRFFSEKDIAGSSAAAGSIEVLQAQAVLQNTFEQAGLTFFTHLIAAATFSWAIPLVEASTGLFVVGRLLFWMGYKYGAKGRAFGFALTFYPNILILLASAFTLLSGSAA